MPRVLITIEDVKCNTKEDSTGDDELYWLSNIRCGPRVDPVPQLGRIHNDQHFRTGRAGLIKITNGQTKRFAPPYNVLYDDNCPFDSYVFGVVCFMENDSYDLKVPWGEVLLGALGLAAAFGGLAGVIGGLVAGLAIGIIAGFGVFNAILGTGLLIALILYLIKKLVGDTKNDDYLGGTIVLTGVLQKHLPPPAPPTIDTDRRLQVNLTPQSAGLDVVDSADKVQGTYDSSVPSLPAPLSTGHNYRITIRLQIIGGHD